MSNSLIYRLDWLLILIYLLLVTVGIVNIYSATYNESLNSIFDFSQLIGKQLLFLIISIFLGIIILGINIKFFENFAPISYIISIVLLGGLFVFGKSVSGAASWYDLGGISFQPSEFSKLGTAMIIAWYMDKLQSDIKKFRTLLGIIVYLLTPSILIMLQPDPGSALVYSAFFFPLFREGLNFTFLAFFFSLTTLFFISLKFEFIESIGIIGILFLIIYFILKRFISKIKMWQFILTFMISIGFSFSTDYIFNNFFE